MSDSPGRSLRRRLDALVFAAFAVVLVAPLVDMFVRPAEVRSTLPELRTPAPPPKLAWNARALLALAPSIDAWWKDGFGLRDRLIRWHNLFELDVLGVRPTDQIELGAHGWLYYATNRALEAELGLAPLGRAELEGWRRMLDARRAWCNARGMRFVVAIVPSKGTAYPEFLPAGFRKVGPSRLEQLAQFLGASWTDDLLDLRQSQFDEKHDDRPSEGDWTWYPLGTHWTDRGAFAGYRAIVAALAKSHPSLAPLGREALSLVDDPTGGDSWASRLYLGDVLRQKSLELEFKNPPTARVAAEDDLGPRSARWIRDDPTAPKLFVIHDSVCTRIRPWFAELFREAVFQWSYDFVAATIEREKPDIVLMLVSDRYLVTISPTVGADLETDRLPAVFESSKEVLLHVDLAHDRPQIKPTGSSVVSSAGDVLSIETKLGSDAVLLPSFTPPSNGVALMHLDIESPSDTQLDLMYRTRTDSNWARKHAWQVELHAGRNDLYLELLAPEMTGELMLRPGREVGRYLVRSLEVRRATR